jgi:excisionase family DNA binding protein
MAPVLTLHHGDHQAELMRPLAQLDSLAMDEEFLTVNEIAEILKVNPMTVRNWISREELPAVRVGSRRVRVRRADFDAFLSRSQTPGPTGNPKNTGKRSSVVVFRGIEAPSLQRKAGPFTSRKLALEWLEQEGLGSTPSDAAEWAAVYPVSDEEVK